MRIVFECFNLQVYIRTAHVVGLSYRPTPPLEKVMSNYKNPMALVAHVKCRPLHFCHGWWVCRQDQSHCAVVYTMEESMQRGQLTHKIKTKLSNISLTQIKQTACNEITKQISRRPNSFTEAVTEIKRVPRTTFLELSFIPEVHTSNHWILSIKSLRIRRRQRLPD